MYYFHIKLLTEGLLGFVETENTEMGNIITVVCIHFIDWF